MAVKIRLAKRGRKALALYDIVVANSSSPRDGRFIEKIGYYNPNTNPATVVLKADKALDWLLKGAQPTDTTRSLLSHQGLMFKKHLQIGVNKGAITQEAADKKFEAWLADKTKSVESAKAGLVKKKEDAKKAAFAAETKVKEARAEAIKIKNTPVAEAPAPAVEEASEEAAAPAEESAE